MGAVPLIYTISLIPFFPPFPISPTHYLFPPSYPAPPPPPCSGVCPPSHSLAHLFRLLGYLLKQAYFFFFYYFTFPSCLTCLLSCTRQNCYFFPIKKSPGFSIHSSIHFFLYRNPPSPVCNPVLTHTPPPKERTTLEGIQRNGSCCSQLAG